ncbi:MAG: helix-turn-helix domain-containing protein [Okeania sp. SIO3B5]|nr:helix-turn-helix domain-containing protein [Okeania sp. SIO3B5]
MGTREAAYLLGISGQRLRVLLAQGRVKGAYKKNGFWKIPIYGSKDEDNEMPVIFPGSRGPKGVWCKTKRSKPTMIHVNQHIIKQNTKKSLPKLKPVVSLKQGDLNYYGYQLEIQGPCRIVYRPHDPTSCGAHLWIDTYSPVQFVDTKFNPVSARRAYKYI